ncbi:MAG: helix-turn-helix domain-containing protein [Pseudonocardiaceae bacterium]|nr:helix-turn-helix domain-containing protein [Pseudonocardiaceae bacterium]
MAVTLYAPQPPAADTAVSESRQTIATDGGRIDGVLLDHDRCYRAVTSRDSRFDGCFVVAVRTTGIYCRPSCPAVTPKPQHVSFLPTAAAAQLLGYRACRRCLPDAVPGSPEWDLRGDLVARAVRLISDGVVEREGVIGLGRRLGYSTRQLNRVLTAELGAGALALARAHRAQAARVLIETTALPLAEVAFAAGFASVRQFNDSIQAVFATTPSALRARRQARPTATGALTLRLPFRAPLDATGMVAFLAARAVPGVESAADGYARTLRLPHGSGTAALRLGPSRVDATLRLAELRDLPVAVSRLRRLLDLDADPAAVDAVLGADPDLTGAVGAAPGIRVPGSVDGTETLLRAVLGQQVSVAAARTAAARLTAALGEAVDTPDAQLSRLFPTAAAIAEHGAAVLTGPQRRIEAVRTVAAAIAEGDLAVDPGRDPDALRAELQALPGIGPWTAGYVVLRVLGATDVLLETDLGIRRGAAALNLPSDVDGLRRHARRWRPWRSYAGMHLWRVAAEPAGRREQTA